jgi:hypothetical protein
MKSTPTRYVPLERSVPEDDARPPLTGSPTAGKGLLLLTLLFFAVVGCSRFADLDDQDRLDVSSSSCINCHTSEAIMIAMLGEVIPGDDGSGGG